MQILFDIYRSVRNENIKYILTPCGNFNKLDERQLIEQISNI
jgi:hypothetical protein